ncbi:hypothetical protein BX661DRAFT_174953 [Kickxella alabastrina]|uniref:uncharacterized protein n=1 Tax=Kickxella alabastrina TaxID=61397 RepID=UPI0022202A13|nr:uncharacterized protein BX661DRAFT_174953 [Kickxella alabastrina]KAI7834498.1 hypothetical protein BX661DRAFT_174953 [Kickxella alabastrina]
MCVPNPVLCSCGDAPTEGIPFIDVDAPTEGMLPIELDTPTEGMPPDDIDAAVITDGTPITVEPAGTPRSCSWCICCSLVSMLSDVSCCSAPASSVWLTSLVLVFCAL